MGVIYTDEGELEFDENELAALEGQHLPVYLRNLDGEFTRCTRWPGQSFIIDPVTNVANIKNALCI